MSIKKSNILLIVGNLSAPGGVSVFWNSLLSSYSKTDYFNFNILQIGGHGKNIFGPIMDQLKLNHRVKSNQNLQLGIVNPSLLNRSFFRDALFSKQMARHNLPFVVFFHGWDLEFEKIVTKKYVNFFLNSFGKAKKIFVLSQEFKDKIIEWGYKGEVVVQTTTVDASLTNSFSLEEKNRTSTDTPTIKILFLSRVIVEKGIFELLEAFENLNKRVENLELIIAGDGEAFNQLKKMVKGKKNIRLTGFVEGEKKIALLKESDLYILPSYTEGLPISVLEAMLFGLPVITTKVGGLKSFFKDKKMGYFIKPKSIIEIEEKIELILSDKQRLKEMGEFNYHYAQEELTNNIVAKRLYAQLKELI